MGGLGERQICKTGSTAPLPGLPAHAYTHSAGRMCSLLEIPGHWVTRLRPEHSQVGGLWVTEPKESLLLVDVCGPFFLSGSPWDTWQAREMCSCVHAHTYTQTHNYIQSYTQAHTLSHIQSHRDTFSYTQRHVGTHSYIHRHTGTHRGTHGLTLSIQSHMQAHTALPSLGRGWHGVRMASLHWAKSESPMQN